MPDPTPPTVALNRMNAAEFSRPVSDPPHPFTPQAIAAAVQAALNAEDVQIPDGKRHAIVTSYDGHSVRAAYAFKVGNVWSLSGDVEWHGGEPMIGIQAHASW